MNGSQEAVPTANLAISLSPGVEAQTYGRAALAVHASHPDRVCDGQEERIAEFASACWERGSIYPLLITCRAAPYILDHVTYGSRTYLLLERALVRAGSSRLLERVDPTVFGSTGAGGRLASLTRRELEVLQLVAEGLSNAEISRTLCVAESTTKVHVSAILAKTGCTNRLQAALVWKDQAAGRSSARD
ncbi:MAG: LuxR C-terminal-related transcriptional regulator [Thermoleophilia bacterium]